MKVSEWISRHPGNAITVPPDWTLEQVIDRMLEEQCLRDIYVTSDDKKVVGHLSHRKLVQWMLSEHQSVHTRRQIIERISAGTAGDLMDTTFVYARPDEEIDEVFQSQLENYVEDMPVIDKEGMLLGAVNMTSVLREIREGGIE